MIDDRFVNVVVVAEKYNPNLLTPQRVLYLKSPSPRHPLRMHRAPGKTLLVGVCTVISSKGQTAAVPKVHHRRSECL